MAETVGEQDKKYQNHERKVRKNEFKSFFQGIKLWIYNGIKKNYLSKSYIQKNES